MFNFTSKNTGTEGNKTEVTGGGKNCKQFLQANPWRFHWIYFSTFTTLTMNYINDTL